MNFDPGQGGRIPSWGKRAAAVFADKEDMELRQQETLGRGVARSIYTNLFAADIGFQADEWQKRYLSSREKRRLLNCSRQIGKSTTVAIKVAHRVIYRPSSMVLLISKGERQSLELMRKVYEVYRLAQDQVPLIHEGATELETVHGSRVVALPGVEGTVRSFSAVDMLVIDEASRVPDELYMSVRPMLAVSGGSIDALSTPFGTRGWWYEEVQRVKDVLGERAKGAKLPWDYYEVPATQCPRLTPEFLLEELEHMGKWWFMQEYMTTFMDAQGQAFSEEDVRAAFAEEVLPWELGRVIEQIEDAWQPKGGLKAKERAIELNNW